MHEYVKKMWSFTFKAFVAQETPHKIWMSDELFLE